MGSIGAHFIVLFMKATGSIGCAGRVQGTASRGEIEEAHMPRDHTERKTYRKSPGRQYEYDPLRSRSGKSQSGRGAATEQSEQSERGTTRRTTGITGTKNTTASLAQRPDPRRTRQLLRQNIIASKTRQGEEDYVESQEEDHYISSPREARPSRSGQLSQPRMPSTRELIDTEEFGRGEDRWRKMEVGPEIDPDFEEDLPPRLKDGERLGVDYGEEPYEDEYPAYPEGVPVRSGALLPPSIVPSPQHDIPVRASRRLPPMRPHPADEPYEDEYDDYEDEYDEDDYEEEEEERPRRKRRKGGLTRRGLLLGVGAAAVIGTGVAAYEELPKLPQAVGATSAAVEKQIQDAFNRGV